MYYKHFVIESWPNYLVVLPLAMIMFTAYNKIRIFRVQRSNVMPLALHVDQNKKR